MTLDEPNVLIAEAQERIDQVRAFLGSATWQDVEQVAEAKIKRALRDFEQGQGIDAELRGEIRAYRHILSIPHQQVVNEERIINNNRGK